MPTLLDQTADRQLTSDFVSELLICRRTVQSYPAAHPAVTAAAERVVKRLAPLLADGRPPTLGVTSKGLVLDGALLDPHNARFQEFAALLASFGIIALTVNATLTPDDLRGFDAILSTPKGEIWEKGGIRQAFSDSAVEGIRVMAINPGVFLLTDDLGPAAADPWDLFVGKLLDGYFSLTRETLAALLAAPPTGLAREFDATLAGMPREARHQSLKAMTEFFSGLDRKQGVRGLDSEMFDKVCEFVAGLSTDLRTDFLLVACRSSKTPAEFNERLLERMPRAELVRVMEVVASQGENVPEQLLQVMQRLSSEADANPEPDAALRADGARDAAQVLFREAKLEEFVPEGYRQTLAAILATDTLPAPVLDSLGALRSTLDVDALERKAAAVMTEVAKRIPLAEQGDGVRHNLVGVTAHFLAAGDFASVLELCRALLSRDRDEGGEKFIDPEFVECVLDAATARGRESYDAARAVITAVGRPFVGALLSRMASEGNRSLRRYWFDCLSKLGDLVRDDALKWVGDDRWYVRRNLVILLRSFSDADVQRHVRRFAEHADARVRNEALKSLLHYKDRNAQRLLVAELASSDPARVLTAVKNAESSDSAEIAEKLLAILEAGGFKKYGVDIKCAAVQSLGSMGRPEALRVFSAVLRSSSLFQAARLGQLKAEIVRALPHFPAAHARPLLREVSESGGPTLAPVAAAALKRLQGG